MRPPIYVFGAKGGKRPPIIAHHLVFTGYGHWLGNDLRGSGSTELREEKFEPLGPVHFGRKRQQPLRDELRAFFRAANPLLKFDKLWFREKERVILRNAFAEVVKDFGYTLYACALCSNHAHLVVRRHKDDAATIWSTFAGANADWMRKSGIVPREHPVWSDRPYAMFCTSCHGVRGRIDYVEQNPLKERLPAQKYDFVVPYDDWPYHKGSRARQP